MAKKEKHKREATQLEEDPQQQSAASHQAGERINWGRGEAHNNAYSCGKKDDMESMKALGYWLERLPPKKLLWSTWVRH